MNYTIETINVEKEPWDVTINSVTNKIYVTSQLDKFVYVIDGNNNTLETINVDGNTRSIAVNPTTNIIYVTNQFNDNITVIDGSNNDIINMINTDSYLRGIAVNPTTNTIYAVHQFDGMVSVIDGSNYDIIKTIDLGKFPFGIAVNPITNKIYVTDYGDEFVYVIDGSTNSVTDVIDVQSFSRSVEVNPITDKIYVTNHKNDYITVIDGSTNTVNATVNIGNNPLDVTVNPTTDKIYVTGYEDEFVYVINGSTNTVIGTVDIESESFGIAANPITNKIYVTNYKDDYISVIGNVIQYTVGDTVEDAIEDTVEEVKSTSGNSCSGDCTSPIFGKHKDGRLIVTDGFSLNGNATNVEAYHTPYNLITINTNEINNMKLKVYENIALKWIQVGLGIPEIGSPMDDAEDIMMFKIGYDDILDEPEILDKHSLVDITRASLNNTSCSIDINIGCYILDFDFVLLDKLKNNVVLIQAVDMNLNSINHYINDGMIVVGETMNGTIEKSVHVPNNVHYPQRAGTVLLTLIDYKNDVWKDEYEYSWSTNNHGPYLIPVMPIPRIVDEYSKWTGYNDRNHSEFEVYKKQQIDIAQNKLNEICPYCNNLPFDKINNTFSYQYPERINTLDNPKMQSKIIVESERAQKIISYILDPILHLK